MRALAQCLSHAPLLKPESLKDSRGLGVADAIENARDALAGFSPDVVVLFGPDHYHGFFNDLMPPFCIGAHARGAGDWGTSTAALHVDSERACAVHEHLMASGFDPAVSHDMRVDHAFAQPLASIVPPASAVIPIFINCSAPPLPSTRRARALGQAIGSHFRESGIRAAFIGSGGLSHDVGFPDVRTATGAERERVLRRRESSPEGRDEAEARIQPFVARFVAGETPLKPLNEEWDREILRQFEQADFAGLERWCDADITRLGGVAAHEIRTWFAALGALRAYGHYRVERTFYACVPEWIVGFGALRAVA
jgi:2,3-dihydroxyphenylpropionate 1,2-dioxygenase